MSLPVEFPSPPPPEPSEEEAQWRLLGRVGALRERLRGNYQLFVGVGILAAFGVIGIYAVYHFGNGLQTLTINTALGTSLNPAGPSHHYPFGTMTGIGVNIFPALLQATPIDLALLGGTILLSLAVGLFAGAYAGVAGGPVDAIVTGVSDLLIGVPSFFLVMVLYLGVQPFVRPNDYLPVFVVLFALILWPFYARPVRARAQQVAGEPYVEAARAAGSGRGRILWRHVLPNSVSTVFAQIPIDLYSLFFVLTTFPFLGCFSSSTGQGFFQDLSPLPTFPYPEWGFLLGEGVCNGWSPLASLDHWWMYFFPGLVVVVFGIGVTLACDGFSRYLAGARATV
jgi:peptide/nickel transport system permease protein